MNLRYEYGYESKWGRWWEYGRKQIRKFEFSVETKRMQQNAGSEQGTPWVETVAEGRDSHKGQCEGVCAHDRCGDRWRWERVWELRHKGTKRRRTEATQNGDWRKRHKMVVSIRQFLSCSSIGLLCVRVTEWPGHKTYILLAYGILEKMNVCVNECDVWWIKLGIARVWMWSAVGWESYTKEIAYKVEHKAEVTWTE